MEFTDLGTSPGGSTDCNGLVVPAQAGMTNRSAFSPTGRLTIETSQPSGERRCGGAHSLQGHSRGVAAWPARAPAAVDEQKWPIFAMARGSRRLMLFEQQALGRPLDALVIRRLSCEKVRGSNCRVAS